MSIPITTSIGLVALISYLLVILVQWQVISPKSDHKGVQKITAELAWFGLLIHAWLLYLWMVVPTGFNLNLLYMISLIAWTIAVINQLLAIKLETKHLQKITLPIALISVWITMHLSLDDQIKVLSQSQLLHIGLSLMAYSLLSLSAIQALMLAWQERCLKTKPSSRFLQTQPPLDSMETALFQIITVGWVILTISIISGLVFIEDIFAQHLVHKTVLSCLAWLVFGILLIGRKLLGWRSKIAVIWTLSGIALLLLGYIGSKFVLEIVLA